MDDQQKLYNLRTQQRMQKGHSGRRKFRGWRHPFAYAKKIDKTVGNLRKQNRKERTRVV